MDSTLLDQIRHLCRDRAAYEHLKAILVQQERVHQLSWEERYEQLTLAQTTQSSDSPASDILTNIIAREKALAQLADTIQRSHSLELVLQVAVQVAQKLLQVDRVAIFRCYEDGRGEFVTDAIAAGLTSLADMPERQLSLARHMIESTNMEHSTQTIDSVRSSTLSSHIVTLLEQIGISSYAANKIYAAQQIWGTLVAFHGSAYHSWAESDRTSLALIASQIGIAISLTNLRLQSEELTDDLQILQSELDKLQQTVIELAEAKHVTALSNPSDMTTISELFPELISESVDDSNIQDAIANEQINQDLDQEDLEPKDLVNDSEQKIANFENSLTPQSDFPEIDLVPDKNTKSSIYNWLRLSFARKNFGKKAIHKNPLPDETNLSSTDVADVNIQEEKNQNIVENLKLFEDRITFNEDDISYVIMPDSLKLISVNNDEPEDIDLEDITVPEINVSDAIASDTSASNLETNESESVAIVTDEIESSQPELSEQIAIAPEPETNQPEAIAQAVIELNDEELGDDQDDLASSFDEDDEPVIEPQFMETIVMVAGNDHKAIEFLLNVIDSYLEEAPRLVQEIDRAIAINNHAKLLQSLNTLRSSSEYIGAVRLAYQCRQLESAVMANYVVLIYACLSRVAIELQQVTDALRIERSRQVTNQ